LKFGVLVRLPVPKAPPVTPVLVEGRLKAGAAGVLLLLGAGEV
jgi:hypothetical protein